MRRQLHASLEMPDDDSGEEEVIPVLAESAEILSMDSNRRRKEQPSGVRLICVNTLRSLSKTRSDSHPPINV